MEKGRQQRWVRFSWRAHRTAELQPRRPASRLASGGSLRVPLGVDLGPLLPGDARSRRRPRHLLRGGVDHDGAGGGDHATCGSGSLVYCMAYRHPAVLANAMVTVDHVSGGRMELGLGAGWSQIEFDAYGIPFLADQGSSRPARRRRADHSRPVHARRRRRFAASTTRSPRRAAIRSRCSSVRASGSVAWGRSGCCAWWRSTPTAGTCRSSARSCFSKRTRC